jgi:nitrate reductase gamma subunit
LTIVAAPAEKEESDERSGGWSTAEKAGIIVGIISGVATVFGLIAGLLVRRRRQEANARNSFKV